MGEEAIMRRSVDYSEVDAAIKRCIKRGINRKPDILSEIAIVVAKLDYHDIATFRDRPPLDSVYRNRMDAMVKANEIRAINARWEIIHE
jgi:hypothetical protein